MGKITFILGGARSGKSTYALKLAGNYRKVAFVATGQGRDTEMRQRIRLHRQTRPKHWRTFEEPLELTGLLGRLDDSFDCIIIDCLTLLASNLILAGNRQEPILERTSALLAALKKKRARAIIISNEVGLGIVPANRLARNFRDIAGKMNQVVAARADEVFFIVSGIPLKIAPSAKRYGAGVV